jgi:hypothetical protein
VSQNVDYYAPVTHKAKSMSLKSTLSGLYNHYCFFRHVSVFSVTQDTTPALITLFTAIPSTVKASFIWRTTYTNKSRPKQPSARKRLNSRKEKYVTDKIQGHETNVMSLTLFSKNNKYCRENWMRGKVWKISSYSCNYAEKILFICKESRMTGYLKITSHILK